MPIQIVPKSAQGQGAFNGGEIIENKPVGFPQDHSSVRPFSSLFYWAHAKAVTDSTIGLHPHQGFEICSFILKGPVRHFDTQQNQWLPLESGDVQIIRSGNGISHSEFMGKGSEMFQIWFDPDLTRTLEQPATYDDYRAADFPVQNTETAALTTLVGEGSPFRMDTPGVEVFRLRLQGGAFSLAARPDALYSVYVIAGAPVVNGEQTTESDFALIREEAELNFQTDENADLFVLASPKQLGYRTYGELRRMQASR